MLWCLSYENGWIGWRFRIWSKYREYEISKNKISNDITIETIKW